MTPLENLTHAVGDLRVTVAKVEGAVNNLTSTITDSKAVDQRFDDRLRSLERFRWQVVGISSAVGTFAGLLAQFVWHH